MVEITLRFRCGFVANVYFKDASPINNFALFSQADRLGEGQTMEVDMVASATIMEALGGLSNLFNRSFRPGRTSYS